jgi:ATP-dependent Lon protease
MVKRCLESGTPFGIIRSSGGDLAKVGTIAEIREATRYVDGRWDLVTLGVRRFTVTRLDREAPYLRAEIHEIGEAIGEPAADVAALAERVSEGFIEYLDLLRGEDGDEHDHDHDHEHDDQDETEALEVTAEAISEALDEADDSTRLSREVVSEIERLLVASSAAGGPPRIMDADESLVELGDDEGDDAEGDDEDGALLETAIDRLTGTDDPVGLSHVVSGVVQLTGDQRQELLEAPDAAARLKLLARHLERENLLLREGVRPWLAESSTLAERRN